MWIQQTRLSRRSRVCHKHVRVTAPSLACGFGTLAPDWAWIAWSLLLCLNVESCNDVIILRVRATVWTRFEPVRSPIVSYFLPPSLALLLRNHNKTLVRVLEDTFRLINPNLIVPLLNNCFQKGLDLQLFILRKDRNVTFGSCAIQHSVHSCM